MTDDAPAMPPLLTVAQAAALAHMTPRQVRRWLQERVQHYPDLVQGSPRKWLVQADALGRALGRERLRVADLAVATAARVSVLERRVDRLEGARRA